MVGLVSHENGLNFFVFFWGEGHTITIFMFTIVFTITGTSGNYETILGTITMVLIDSKLDSPSSQSISEVAQTPSSPADPGEHVCSNKDA